MQRNIQNVHIFFVLFLRCYQFCRCCGESTLRMLPILCQGLEICIEFGSLGDAFFVSEIDNTIQWRSHNTHIFLRFVVDQVTNCFITSYLTIVYNIYYVYSGFEESACIETFDVTLLVPTAEITLNPKKLYYVWNIRLAGVNLLPCDYKLLLNTIVWLNYRRQNAVSSYKKMTIRFPFVYYVNVL